MLKLGIGLIIAALLFNSPCLAQSVLDRALAKANPCAGLVKETSIVGIKVKVAIDQLKEVSVGSATVTVQNDQLHATASAHLDCATSDNATIKGDAAADLAIDASAGLASCATPTISVELSNFGGLFGDILAPAKGLLEDSIRTSLEQQWVKTCMSIAAAGP